MSSPSPSSSSELRSALAGAPAPVLETALSLLDASAPLIESPEAAAAGALSAEDRKIWLAAVARLAIRVVAVLEGARGVEIDCEEQQQRTAAAFEEGRKASPAQQLPLTLSALLAALDVRYAVFDRNWRERARHLCGLALAWGVEMGAESDFKKRGERGGSKTRPSLSLELPAPSALGQKKDTGRRTVAP